MCLRFSVSAPVPPLQCLRSSASAPVSPLQYLISSASARMECLFSPHAQSVSAFSSYLCVIHLFTQISTLQTHTNFFPGTTPQLSCPPLGPSRTPVSVRVCYPIFFIIRMIFLYLHLFQLLQTAPVPGKSVIAFSSYLRVIQLFMQISTLQTHTNFFPGTTPQLSWPPLSPSRTPCLSESVIPYFSLSA